MKRAKQAAMDMTEIRFHRDYVIHPEPGIDSEVMLPLSGIHVIQFSDRIFQEVRAAVEAMEIPLSDNTLQVTVSIGATTTLGNNLEEMMKLADEGVYQSKEQGRNRVTLL